MVICSAEVCDALRVFVPVHDTHDVSILERVRRFSKVCNGNVPPSVPSDALLFALLFHLCRVQQTVTDKQRAPQKAPKKGTSDESQVVRRVCVVCVLVCVFSLYFGRRAFKRDMKCINIII